MSTLEAVGLTKTYENGTIALSQLDLSVGAGEIFCLLGANGAGKTTTIQLFLGLINPSSGTARVGGTPVHRDPLSARRKLAYIPEQVNLYLNLTGLENLSYFAELATGERHTPRTLTALLVRAGLPETAATRRVSTYSKGMRQKVGIAIALAKEAEALLLDEPTSGLDPQASNEFAQSLCLLSERGVAVLMATHDLFRARESGTRLGIMRQGKLLTTMPAAEIGHNDLERLYLNYMAH
jgi:ABC-2 type transport system ATP-binding protein